jgi:hypothetical protein
MNRTLSQFFTPIAMDASRIAPSTSRNGTERPRALGRGVGMGRAIAVLLARAGMDVVIGYLPIGW